MINWFEQYYDEFIDFASALVFKNNLPCDPADLVNDAYIKFTDGDEDFSVPLIKKLIYSSHFIELQEVRDKRCIGEVVTPKGNLKQWSKKAPSPKGSQVCSSCNELIPVGGFHVTKFLKGGIYLHPECKNCALKRKKKWFAEHREHWNSYVRSRYKKVTKPKHGNRGTHQEQIERALKKYNSRIKENLEDPYIRKCLKYKYKNQQIPPEAIEAKRKELFEKRRNANTRYCNLSIEQKKQLRREAAKRSYEKKKLKIAP